MQSTTSLNSTIPSATVIIPAYNEEKRIGKVLGEIADFISKNNLNWNIIVSIDGNDGTENIVKNLSTRYDIISYNKSSTRGGKGFAIKRAVKDATGEFTILMDADGSIDFKKIVGSFVNLSNFDVILFDRYSNRDNKIPLIRRIPSRGFNLLIRVLLRIKVNDTQCGYKIIRTDMLKEAFKKVTVTNTFYDVDLLYHLYKMNARIKEVEIEYRHDDQSKFNVFSEVIGQGVSLIAFRLRHSRFYKFIPDWARILYYKKFRWI